MKRKWIWALTALLLSVGFVLVKRVADKRPRVMARDVETPTLVVSPIADERAILVARDVEASLLEVSPDGQLLFAHSEAQQSATVIGLKEDLRVVIPVDYNPVSAFFSADSRRIYEIYNQPDVNADGIDNTLANSEERGSRVGSVNGAQVGDLVEYGFFYNRFGAHPKQF